MKKPIVLITEVLRIKDDKIFHIGDLVTEDGFFRGEIEAFNFFEDDVRVHLIVDEDSGDPEYYSISEIEKID